MNKSTYQLNIGKESFKFSSAHMTVFPDGTKETLHGHNYQVNITLGIQDDSVQSLVSFSYFKKIIEGICRSWHSKVLLAKNCPFFQIRNQTAEEIEFLLCNKRYVLPIEDIHFLEIDNISSELLSRAFYEEFVSKIKPELLSNWIRSISVKIEETPGQGATYHWENPKAL